MGLKFPDVPVMLCVMTHRTRAEVGAAVRERRLNLGMTPNDVVVAAGVDPKTYTRLEDGTRWPQERSRLKIEGALRWQSGSIEALLQGGEPRPLPNPVDAGGSAATASITGQNHLEADSADRLLALIEVNFPEADATPDELAEIADVKYEIAQADRRFAELMLEQMFRYMDLAAAIQRRAHPEIFEAIKQGEQGVLEAAQKSDAQAQAVEDQEVSDGAKRTPLVFRTGERTTPREHRANEG